MAGMSFKQVQIDKNNTRTVIIVAATVFVTIFSLVACKALISQYAYQQRVIGAREQARDKLEANVAAASTLNDKYKQFISDQQNIIGGSSTGTGTRDGDNGRIVLDALPSKYDFPALTTSLEKLIKDQNVSISGITGTDDEINQGLTGGNPQPQPVEMPFTTEVSGDYDSLQKLVGIFEKSIRPFHVNKLEFTARQGSGVTLTIDAKTYYQPEKSLNFKEEVVL